MPLCRTICYSIAAAQVYLIFPPFANFEITTQVQSCALSVMFLPYLGVQFCQCYLINI